MVTMLSLHVDDGFVAASNMCLIEEFKIEMSKLFKDQVHFMSTLNLYTAVGIEYDQKAKVIKLNQKRYINEELNYREDRDGSKLCSIGSVAMSPMFNTSLNLRLQEPNPNNESLLV
jgi:Reverse transcriptase (RNA-dependent DNA polymerase)